ncbi:MAG: glycoside hydrolase family 43 protein [Actinomycetota bacterium]|nr:glycoside hydrolase family 43 protein [Actinomycetota bacterium]
MEWPLGRLPTLVIAGVVVGALIGALVSVARRAGGDAAPRLPRLGQARDVYDGDLGDPFILPVTAPGQAPRFVAFGTGDWPSRVPTARSSDLTTWQEGPDALPQLPVWAAPDPGNSFSWAPAALDTGRGFVLYVSLPDAESGQQCIGAATSTIADGPYAGTGEGPMVCQHELGGSIDPTVTRDRAGKLHLIWKNDGNALGLPSTIWEQALTDDGLGVVGPIHRLLTASQPWQGGIIEEPAVIPAADGGWWLFYSGNFFDRPEYATGLAHCTALEGPCTEAGDGPVLATAQLDQPRQSAPGGLETFQDGHGGLWAVFDTWNRPTRNGRFYCCRSLQLAPVLSS